MIIENIESLNFYANQVKDVLLQDMMNDKIINESQFKELSKTKIIINVKLNTISAFFYRLLKKYPSIKDNRIIVATVKSLKDEFEEVPIKKEDIKEIFNKEGI